MQLDIRINASNRYYNIRFNCGLLIVEEFVPRFEKFSRVAKECPVFLRPVSFHLDDYFVTSQYCDQVTVGGPCSTIKTLNVPTAPGQLQFDLQLPNLA